jgi:hypothetical protein
MTDAAMRWVDDTPVGVCMCARVCMCV